MPWRRTGPVVGKTSGRRPPVIPAPVRAVNSVGRWLRRPRPVANPRLRLVCLPHGGGTAGAFYGWTAWLPADVELVAVQYPGRQDRFGEPCLRDMGELADAVAQALLPLLDRPVALFGHSMGAALAYEVTLRLETQYRARRGSCSSRAAPPRRARGKDGTCICGTTPRCWRALWNWAVWTRR